MEKRKSPRYLIAYILGICAVFVILIFMSLLARRQSDLVLAQAETAQAQTSFATEAQEQLKKLQIENAANLENDTDVKETLQNVNEQLTLMSTELKTLLDNQIVLDQKITELEADKAALAAELELLKSAPPSSDETDGE